MSTHRRLRAATWLFVSAATSLLSGLASANDSEVIVTGDAVEPAALEIVAAALGDAVTVKRAPNSPACEGSLVRTGVRARVWVNWSPAGGSAPLQLCFQDACRSTTRELGPFAKLDARAREELITVIESGLAALAQSCAPGQDTVPSDSTSNLVAPGYEGSAAPDEQKREPVSAGEKRELASAADHREPTSQTTGSQPATAAQAASTPTSTLESTAPATTDSPTSAGHTERSSFAFGVSYGLSWWNDSVLAQQFSAIAAYAMTERAIYLGLELGYVPRFHASRNELGVDASSIRVALDLWIHSQLTERWSFDALLGPALEWLSLSPDPDTAARLLEPHSPSHVDPLFSAKVGPAFRVYGPLFVGIDMQLDIAWIQRTFGYDSDSVDGPVPVFSPDRYRFSIALNARAAL